MRLTWVRMHSPTRKSLGYNTLNHVLFCVSRPRETRKSTRGGTRRPNSKASRASGQRDILGLPFKESGRPFFSPALQGDQHEQEDESTGLYQSRAGAGIGYFAVADITESRAVRQSDPLNRLNIAIIGAGGQGGGNLGSLAKLNENIVALCDVDAAGVRLF